MVETKDASPSLISRIREPRVASKCTEAGIQMVFDGLESRKDNDPGRVGRVVDCEDTYHPWVGDKVRHAETQGAPRRTNSPLTYRPLCVPVPASASRREQASLPEALST